MVAMRLSLVLYHSISEVVRQATIQFELALIGDGRAIFRYVPIIRNESPRLMHLHTVSAYISCCYHDRSEAARLLCHRCSHASRHMPCPSKP